MFKKYMLFNVNLEGLDDKPRWYTLTTGYNYEQKVAKDLLKKASLPEYQDKIVDAFSGVRENQLFTTLKSGEIKIKSKFDKVLTNYAFVKATMTPEIWNDITGMTGVSGVVCISGRPVETLESKINETRELVKSNLLTAQDYIDYRLQMILEGANFPKTLKLDSYFNVEPIADYMARIAKDKSILNKDLAARLNNLKESMTELK